MSDAARASTPAELPAVTLLERRVGEAAAALALWRRRALAAEAAVADVLAVAGPSTHPDTEPGADSAAELRRLRAENTALKSRLGHAHRRVGLLLDWLGALEGEP